MINYPGYSQIKVSILDENGKQIKTYSKSDFKDYSHGQNFVLYTDDRVLFLTPEDSTFPYTVVAEYTVNTSNTIFFPSFIPFHSYKISLEKATINIKNTSGINLRTKVNQALLQPLQNKN